MGMFDKKSPEEIEKEINTVKTIRRTRTNETLLFISKIMGFSCVVLFITGGISYAETCSPLIRIGVYACFAGMAVCIIQIFVGYVEGTDSDYVGQKYKILKPKKRR